MSSYCDKVRARASGDAALLMAPRVFVQGLKFPANGQVDVGVTAGSGYQVRAGLSFSPLDFFRGMGTLRVGEADCEQRAAAEPIQELLAEGDQRPRLDGLRAQVSYLREHRAEWLALADKATVRLSEHVITLIEFDTLRQAVDALEHKLVQAEGAAEQIASRAPAEPRGSLTALGQRYVRRALRFERASSALRELDGWQVLLTGGVVPEAPVDWYGLAEVSFSLGGFQRSHEERRYLAARGEELQHARYELESQLDELRAQMLASLDEAKRDVAIVDRDVAFLSDTLKALENSEAESIAHARDTLTLQRLAAEADGVYLRTIMVRLTELLEESHGS